MVSWIWWDYFWWNLHHEICEQVQASKGPSLPQYLNNRLHEHIVFVTFETMELRSYETEVGVFASRGTILWLRLDT